MIIKFDLLRRPTNYAWKFGWGISNISCKKLWYYGHTHNKNNIQTQLKTIATENGVFLGGNNDNNDNGDNDNTDNNNNNKNNNNKDNNNDDNDDDGEEEEE